MFCVFFTVSSTEDQSQYAVTEEELKLILHHPPIRLSSVESRSADHPRRLGLKTWASGWIDGSLILTDPLVSLIDCGGEPETQMKPTAAHGEHANSTQNELLAQPALGPDTSCFLSQLQS